MSRAQPVQPVLRAVLESRVQLARKAARELQEQQVPLALLVLRERRVVRVLRDLQVRLDHKESRAQPAPQDLRDLKVHQALLE